MEYSFNDWATILFYPIFFIVVATIGVYLNSKHKEEKKEETLKKLKEQKDKSLDILITEMNRSLDMLIKERGYDLEDINAEERKILIQERYKALMEKSFEELSSFENEESEDLKNSLLSKMIEEFEKK
tara:strand:+ start:151 stop:534 length:384 start_codon:yes stop_codon:yes gene_type:complete